MVALVYTLSPATVFAVVNSSKAAKGTGQALEIAPPIIEVTGNPGQTIQTKLYLRDISSGPLIVSNQINDFVAKGDSGVPQIIFNTKTSDPYSLRTFIAPLPQLLLQPQQLKLLPISIHIPANASPGGHYGVIRFTGTSPSLNGQTGVSLSASLGALILLTVNGKLVEQLSTQSFTVSQNGNKPSNFFQSDPFTFNELIRNSGNVHVQPTGLLTLKDMFGHTVVQMNINEAQGNILPGSARLFTQQLSPVNVSNKRFFGRYTASFKLTYGSPAKTVTGTVSFWVIPVKLIVLWIVGLIAGFFLIRWLIRRYNKHILDKAQKTKKK